MQEVPYGGAGLWCERSLSLYDKICIENKDDWTSVEYQKNYFNKILFQQFMLNRSVFLFNPNR
ncbi:hypothetical protein AM1BK_22460 [Neobacillus kokaensis]|uniref:Uncharacterized protein n=1 Tax=Neobacillus kokaensis TaxID=2759023 RepID=A0ABQ3N5D2_9BACI|nr:hypothetical protein AM1BK_22460 [Neobacillus kokaensis]